MRHTTIVQGLNGDNLERHLKELLSDSAVRRCRCAVAWVTLDALLRLGTKEDGTLFRFVSSPNRRLEWVVGVDRVTTADALREFQRLSSSAPEACDIKAFSSSEGRLFHPKVFIFDRENGRSTVLVGSANLTPAGLSENFEIVARLDDLTITEMSQWNKMWGSCLARTEIKPIDDELVTRVASDRRVERQIARRRRRVRRIPEELRGEITPPTGPKILARYVPLAGGRTSQVHLTRPIVENFFRLPLRPGEMVRLQQVQPGHSPQSVEERPLVYSQKNKNPKIELNGARVLIGRYPTGDRRPIVVFQEVGPRFYKYMLLLPSDSGHRRLSRQLDLQPKEGGALRSWITDLDSLAEVWPDYPH